MKFPYFFRGQTTSPRNWGQVHSSTCICFLGTLPYFRSVRPRPRGSGEKNYSYFPHCCFTFFHTFFELYKCLNSMSQATRSSSISPRLLVPPSLPLFGSFSYIHVSDSISPPDSHSHASLAGPPPHHFPVPTSVTVSRPGSSASGVLEPHGFSHVLISKKSAHVVRSPPSVLVVLCVFWD